MAHGPEMWKKWPKNREKKKRGMTPNPIFGPVLGQFFPVSGHFLFFGQFFVPIFGFQPVSFYRNTRRTDSQSKGQKKPRTYDKLPCRQPASLHAPLASAVSVAHFSSDREKLSQLWARPALVAFQTQTQNRSVLATQFPKSHPCPRWGCTKSQF